MKKLFILAILLLALSSCSVDWDGSKDREIEELKEKVEELTEKLEEADSENILKREKIDFENNLKCQERADIMKKTYTNIHAGFYNSFENKCYVKFYSEKENKIKEGPMEDGGPQDVIEKVNSSQETAVGEVRTILQDVQFREGADISSPSQGVIKQGTEVYLLSKSVDTTGNIWFATMFNDKFGYINNIAFSVK